MTRHDMIERIGNTYMTSNIEGGEYSYIQAAGSRANLEKALGRSISHFKLDIRFEKGDIVVLVETKQLFKNPMKNNLMIIFNKSVLYITERKLLLFLRIQIMRKSRFGNLLSMMNTF